MRDMHVDLAGSRLPVVRRRGAWRRSLTAIVLLTMLATAVAVVGTTSSAAALPTNCTTTLGADFADSLCTGGTGEHRVYLSQKSFNPMTGYFACEGPWVPVGTVSRTTCAHHIIISLTSQTRELVDPGMGGTPMPPPTGPPPPGCHITGNALQTWIEPVHLKAMWFGFTLEYCYNSARDLVRVTPRLLPPLIQLPAEETARGYPVGRIGTMRINSVLANFLIVTENTPPIRTSQGNIYSGIYTVNASFIPYVGAIQNAQASVGVVINADGAFPTRPVFIRTA